MWIVSFEYIIVQFIVFEKKNPTMANRKYRSDSWTKH